MVVKWRVELYRRLAGWTQTELAHQSGVPLRTIQRIENLEHSPKPDTLMSLAAAFSRQLQIDIDWRELQTEAEDMQRFRKEVARDYDAVAVRVADSGLDITNFLTGVQALSFDVKADGLTQAAQDEVANFHSDVSDWLDIWSGLDPRGQHDAGKSLDKAREALSHHGLVVVGGQTPFNIRSCNVLHKFVLAVILICEAGAEPKYVLRRRQGR